MSAPSPTRSEAGERGTLRIDSSVVRKLAERAADGVQGTAVVTRRVAGLGVGEHGAHVKVAGHGSVVDLSLDIPLHYPGPVRDIVDNLRAAVTETVEHVTAYQVRSLAITISALQPHTEVRVQ